MKRCPVCHNTYADTMSFCRLDGRALVGFHANADDQQTLLKLPSLDNSSLATEILTSGRSLSNPLMDTQLMTPVGRRRRSAKAKIIDSLAVLPLTNAEDDPQIEYLADGITESIINSLSQLPKLRIVPRSTVFRYKGRDADPLEIGFLLGVRAVLTGRIFQLGDSLIVKTELIDVTQESQLWGEQFRSSLTDIFALQDEISSEISEKLRLRLTGDDKKRLNKRYTQNTEAYHCYLKGRFYTNKRTTEWIMKGIDAFQNAIDLDPNYALAYAGLADAYAFLGSSTGERPPVDFYPRTKAAATKALELDDSLAEAHSSLGFFNLMYEWNFPEARREFRRALELNPNYVTALDGYGFYLKATGQHNKAIRECIRAQKMDPLSLFAKVSTAWAYYFAQQYENAIEHNRAALELDSRFVFAYWNMGLALAQQGKTNESIDALERAVKYSGDGLTFTAHLGYVNGLAGHHSEAEQILAGLEKLTKKRYVPAYYFSIIYLGLGKMDKVFEWLEHAREERNGFLAFIEVEPMFAKLKLDSRFAAFTNRLSQPE